MHLYLEKLNIENRMPQKRIVRESYIRCCRIQHFLLDYRIRRSWGMRRSKGCKEKKFWAGKIKCILQKPTATVAGWGLGQNMAPAERNRNRVFCRLDASSLAMPCIGRLWTITCVLWTSRCRRQWHRPRSQQQRQRLANSLEMQLWAKSTVWWWLQRGRKSEVSRGVTRFWSEEQATGITFSELRRERSRD